jgi:hypothetical protein
VQRATLLRNAGTDLTAKISLTTKIGAGSAAHHFVLRRVRGTPAFAG